MDPKFLDWGPNLFLDGGLGGGLAGGSGAAGGIHAVFVFEFGHWVEVLRVYNVGAPLLFGAGVGFHIRKSITIPFFNHRMPFIWFGIVRGSAPTSASSKSTPAALKLQVSVSGQHYSSPLVIYDYGIDVADFGERVTQ